MRGLGVPRKVSCPVGSVTALSPSFHRNRLLLKVISNSIEMSSSATFAAGEGFPLAVADGLFYDEVSSSAIYARGVGAAAADVWVWEMK